MSSPAKLRPATAPVVFTGNFLADGRVAWLAAGGAWTASIAEARIFPAEASTAALPEAQQGERDQRVVGVYAVEVALEAGLPVPRRYRERLRVTGPSVAAEPAPRLALAS